MELGLKALPSGNWVTMYPPDTTGKNILSREKILWIDGVMDNVIF